MKSTCLLLLFSLFVVGCTTCDLPLGNYASSTNSEYEFSMSINERAFSLEHQAWSPGNYENKRVELIEGTWSCSGSSVKFSADGAAYRATYEVIGVNPFGLPVDTKALFFESSEGSVLSKEILYPSRVLN